MTNQSALFIGNIASNARFYRAPGRVNIIGEHTDYNDGFVLPTNTALYTWLAVSPRNDRVVSVNANNFAEHRSFIIDAIEPSDKPEWIDYLKGVCAEIESAGVQLRGADIAINGEIPIGSGLSSSASLEIAMATAMLATANASLPPQVVAKLCQQAEHKFAGVNCGIMDQFSIACCDPGEAILLDCRDLDTESVAIPKEIALLVTDSGVNHKLSDGGYNQRAKDCRDAVTILQSHNTVVTSLRDATATQLQDRAHDLGEILLRRARHVVTENERTKSACNALNVNDIDALGKLVNASHKSLRDDFEVSCEEIETLIDIANNCDGVLGSRMVGAGFGGCVLSVVRADQVKTARQQISQAYRTAENQPPWMHTVAPTRPAEEYIKA